MRGIEPPTFGSTVRLLNTPLVLISPEKWRPPARRKAEASFSPRQAALVCVSRRHVTNLDSRFRGVQNQNNHLN